MCSGDNLFSIKYTDVVVSVDFLVDMMGLINSKSLSNSRSSNCGIFSVKSPDDFPEHVWEAALERVGTIEKGRILSYVFKKDQVRALLSTLLQRKVISQCFETTEFIISRTPEVCYHHNEPNKRTM